MKHYFVYLLECSDKSIYVGLTNSIDRRLKEHQLGLNDECYTYSRRPVKLIFSQGFIQFKQAMLFEKKIKKWSRKKKLALANENYDELRRLSVCQNNSNSINFKN